MYGTFANSEFLRSLAYRGILLNNIIGDINGTFFYISFQRNTLIHCFFYNV